MTRVRPPRKNYVRASSRAATIYGLIQETGRSRAVYTYRRRIRSEPFGTALYDDVISRKTLIGVYDTRATVAQIQADLEEVARARY
jgi:hypothetical protein